MYPTRFEILELAIAHAAHIQSTDITAIFEQFVRLVEGV